MRQVEQDAPHLGIPAQDADQVRAVPAADVGQDADPREVVGVEHRLRLPTVDRRHGGIEDLGLFGMLAQVLEDRLAVEAVEGGLAGADALQQVAPGVVMLVAHHDGHRPLRAGHVLAEALGQRGLGEPLVFVLREDADAG